jgi:hypothetical protein
VRDNNFLSAMKTVAMWAMLWLPVALGFVGAPSACTRSPSLAVCARRGSKNAGASAMAGAKALDQASVAAALADAHAEARSRLVEAGFTPDEPPGFESGDFQVAIGPAGTRASVTVASFRGVDVTRNAWYVYCTYVM